MVSLLQVAAAMIWPSQVRYQEKNPHQRVVDMAPSAGVRGAFG